MGVCEIIRYNIKDFVFFMGCIHTNGEMFEICLNKLLIMVIVISSHGDL